MATSTSNGQSSSPNKSSSETRSDYSAIGKTLHWLVAALIGLQYVLIELAHIAEQTNATVKQLAIIANHKSIGITILVIAIIRLVYRLNSTPPTLPESMPSWQKLASNTSHFLLYFCLFALPVSGWLMSSANAYSVSWFNLIALPDLISANKTMAETLATMHLRLSDALIILAAVHVIAAIKHHVVDKDNVLTRMSSKGTISIGLITLLAGVLLWGKVVSISSTQDETLVTTQTLAETLESPASEQTEDTQAKISNLPLWNIDYSNSYIDFTGEQAGAPFTGRWNKWEGKLQFDPAALDQSVFDVSIEIGSVGSNDEERDSTILSPDFFNVIEFPIARFYANDFVSIDPKSPDFGDNEFIAKGTLSMKGISQACELKFKITNTEKGKELQGIASLNRHQWNIGVGDWADPTWVGSDVLVNVKVLF